MGEPNFFVPIALLGYALLTVVCFRLLEPRLAVLCSLLGGWLFLPQFDGHFKVLALGSKAAFVPAVVLVGSITFDGRWRKFRPCLFDVPVAVLCLAPFVTAFSNDLGLKEASSAMLDAAMTWGAPYVLGRLYFRSSRALSELSAAVAAAALVYVPLCLWEIRMSPHLHYSVYGFRSENFTTMVRFGGFRPGVFLQSGLAVAMLMAVGTLSAYWLWRTGVRHQLGGVPLKWLCILLFATTGLCKSTGAIFLLGLGIAVLEGTRLIRAPVLILALAVIPPAYCVARISGWSAEQMVDLAKDLANEERAESIQFRLDNERLLMERAKIRPWLGWGRFGRSLVYGEEGQQLTIVDSMWIIAFGSTGLLGLLALGAMLAIPPLALSRTIPARYWIDARIAPAASLAVALLLWALDNLLNAMMTPVFPAIMGALISLVIAVRVARSARPVHPRAKAAFGRSVPG